MRCAKLLTCSAALAAMVLGTAAWAQDGRPDRPVRPPQLSKEKAEAAWRWQGKGVARDLALAPEQADKLVQAYLANRKELSRLLVLKALNEPTGVGGGEGRGEGRGRGRDFGRDRGAQRFRRGLGVDPELADATRASLRTDLEAFLTPAQTDTAVASLGTFNPQWDRMVDAVAGLGLDEEKTYAALTPVREYVVAIAKLRALRASGDREAMREGMMDAREDFREGLAKVLTDDQLAKFRDATGRRGRGRGGLRGGAPAGDPDQTVGGAKVGEPAPAFAIKDTTGRTHDLAAYEGRIVVLQWINPDCPVCRRVASTGLVTAMKEKLAKIDGNVAHLAINSTHYMEPATGAAYLAKHKIDAPVLVDRDGTVGRRYGAKTTPHMFVIDGNGVLRYAGAIDDDPGGAKGDEAANHVVRAVSRIVAGETVAPDTTKPYGCSVKYAPPPSGN